MKIYLTISLLFLIPAFALCQEAKKGQCYQENASLNSGNTFEKMEIPPSYDGNVDKLNGTLLNSLNIERILADIPGNTRFLTDTLDVRFIISKEKRMSNLTVTTSRNAVLQEEIRKAIINSACNWRPGLNGGRLFNGWFRSRLIFLLDRRGRFLSIKIDWVDIPD